MPATAELIKICGWCPDNKAKTASAAARLAAGEAIVISHGICADCKVALIAGTWKEPS